MNRKVARSGGQGNRVGDDHLNIDSHLNSSFHHFTTSLQVISFGKYKFFDLHWKPSAGLANKVYSCSIYGCKYSLNSDRNIEKCQIRHKKKKLCPCFFFFKTNELSVLRQF